MRALVVNPWITDFKLYDEWMHPLGLYLLISLLKHNGIKTDYYNCLERSGLQKKKRFGTGMFEELDIQKPEIYRDVPRRYRRFGVKTERFEHDISSFPSPDIIFVGSSMTYWLEGVVATVQSLSSRFPTTPIVVGGTAAILCPQVLRTRLPGVVVVTHPLSSADDRLEISSDLPELRTAQWHRSILPGLQSVRGFLHGPILTSLCCPMRCKYCASHNLAGKYTCRSPETILAETDYLIDTHGVRHFSVFDDAFLYRSAEHVLPLLYSLARRSIASIHAPNGLHLRYITRETADAMRAARFVTLRFGYESGSRHHSGATSGKTSGIQLQDKLRILTDAGFSRKDIGIYVMGGLPGQLPQDMLAEIQEVASLGVKPKPVFLSPVPGTELFDYYLPQVPQIAVDPLSHNDMLFVALLRGWSLQAMEEIRHAARELGQLVR